MEENTIQNLDDFLDNLDNDFNFYKKPKSKLSKEEQILYGDNDENKQKLKKSKVSKKPKKDEEPIEISKKSVDALKKHARSIVTNFVEKTPGYLQYKQQKNILLSKLKDYKAIKDEKNVQIIKDEIERLNKAYEKYKNVITPVNSETLKNAEQKIKNSPEIKKLDKKIKKINEEIDLLKPNSLIGIIEKSRSTLIDSEEILNNLGINDYDSDYNSESDEEIIDIEDIIDDFDIDKQNKSTDRLSIAENKLNNALKAIEKITDTPFDILKNMETKDIRKLLKDCWTEELTEKLKSLENEASDLNAERSAETRKIRGYNDLSDIMYEMFNYDEIMYIKINEKGNEEIVAIDSEDINENEKKLAEIKNVIAANNVKYVENLAYKECIKLGMLERFDDAVGFGCLGMSKAINNWLIKQTKIGMSLGFTAIAYKYIVNEIRRGMYEFTNTGGMINGSSLADIISREKTAKNDIRATLIKSGIPKDIIETGALNDIVDNIFMNTDYSVKHGKLVEIEYDDETGDNKDINKKNNRKKKRNSSGKINKVINASTLNATIGGDDDDNAVDVFNYVKSSDDNDIDTFEENEVLYQNVLEGLREMFNCFDYAEITNEKGQVEHVQLKTKMFSKLEYEIFLYYFGFIPKIIKLSNGEEKYATYTEKEIAENLLSKKMKQTNVFYHKEKIIKKIKKLIEYNPKIKQAFEYLMYMLQNNRNSYTELFYTTSLSDGKKRATTTTEKFEEARINSLKLNTIFDSDIEIDEDLMIDDYNDMMNY